MSAPEARDWIDPEPCPPQGRGRVLSRAQIERWRSQGFALVDGVFPADLLAETVDDARARFPEPGTAEAARFADFGSGGRFVFPAESDSANAMTLHPRLLGAISELLGLPVAELRLTQSDLWPKYGRTGPAPGPHDNDDQRIHVDYPNHTLTHPPRWGAPRPSR